MEIFLRIWEKEQLTGTFFRVGLCSQQKLDLDCLWSPAIYNCDYKEQRKKKTFKLWYNGETDQPAKARCTLSGIDSCTRRCLQPVPTLGIIFLSFLVWCLVSWSRKGFSPMDTKHSSWSAQLILRPHKLGEWEWSVQGLVKWHCLYEKGTGCFAAFPYFKRLLKLWWPPNKYKEP